MAHRRDGLSLTVFGDAAAVDRIRRVSRITGFICAAVAVWAAVWFSLVLIAGEQILGIDNSEGALTLIGVIGLGVAVFIGIVAVMLLTRARKLARTPQPVVLRLGPDGISAIGHAVVPWPNISLVVVVRGKRPTQWSPTIGGTLGNELGSKVVGMPDQARLLEVRRHHGRPVRLNLAMHLSEPEFAALAADLESVLGQLRIPVALETRPSPA